MNLTYEQIKDIAGDLDCGMNVYVNINTHEVITIPDLDEFTDETDAWQEDIDKVQDNPDNYLCIEKLDSREAYNIMSNFVDTVADSFLKMRLEKAISKAKPFANFRAVLQKDPQMLNNWYEFKENAYIQYVEDVLERFNNSYETDLD